MEIKMLSMRALSEETEIPYSMVSGVLCGRFVHPAYLERLRKAIEDAPMPELQPA
jgi:hypothetical protein